MDGRILFEFVAGRIQFYVRNRRCSKARCGVELREINKKSGQVMLEYMVATAVFVAVIILCAMLLYAFKTYGGRVLSLMAIA